jgi:uncharacterized membrane protein YdbT with pleckstrin-like domain
MDENLPKSDQPMLIFKKRKSFWFIVLPLAFLFLCIVLMSLVYLSISGQYNIDPILNLLVISLLVFGVGVAAVIVVLDWANTYYILTDATIEVIRSFVTQTKTYVSLHDLSRIEGKIGILGYIFNYGTITIESETTERTIVLSGVSDSNQIIDLIREARAHVANTDK